MSTISTWQYWAAVLQMGVGGFGVKAAWTCWNDWPSRGRKSWFALKMFAEITGFGFSVATVAYGLRMLLEP